MAGYGSFVWYELHTSDRQAAQTFYGKVAGWNFSDSGQPGMDYTFISTGNDRIGGIMQIPENACEAHSHPAWLGYIDVEDADACAAKVEAKCGRILRAPEDIPGYGRFAVLADPQGAVFAVISPAATMANAPVQVHREGVPGYGGWHELYADDPDAAWDFYSNMFGWTKDRALDMGEMGVYQLYALNGVTLGGMLKRCGEMPGPRWNYYFNVASIDAAVDRIREAGGRLLFEPHEVAGGAWIVTALDPQGAPFSLVEPPKK